jgi:microsomal dipeptidase-like Zn-dependent dipeptidase
MLADLHVHYPMHVVSDAASPRTPHRRTLKRMRRVQGRAGVGEKGRALILTIASLLFNDRSWTSGWRATAEQMREGEVALAMSVLYRPFEEMDLERRYEAPPASSYFAGLLADLTAVEDEVSLHDPSAIRLVHNRAELECAIRDGATALVHCVEGGFHLGDQPDEISANVATLASKGVAYITPAHLFFRQVATNAPAIPFLRTDATYRWLFPQPADRGLTDRGVAMVKAMVANRVMVDISHMSDAAIKETFELLGQLDPDRHIRVIASHGGYRFGAQEYMLDEWTIREIERRDGVIGLIMAQYQLNDGLRRRHTKNVDESLEVIFRHIDEIARVTGSHRHVALGTDFDGFIKPTMTGLESAGDLDCLERALRNRYGDATDLICWKNALRMLRWAWPP